MLALAKVDYVDKRYSDREEWFAKDKQGLGLEFPNASENKFLLFSKSVTIFYFLHYERLLTASLLYWYDGVLLK